MVPTLQLRTMTTLTVTIPAILAIIVGGLILVWPKLLRYGVGLYLIIFGIMQLLG